MENIDRKYKKVDKIALFWWLLCVGFEVGAATKCLQCGQAIEIHFFSCGGVF